MIRAIPITANDLCLAVARLTIIGHPIKKLSPAIAKLVLSAFTDIFYQYKILLENV